MPNKWNERDLLRLTQDCELGTCDALLHVVKTVGPYMTVRRLANDVLLHTGRDYTFATKIGEGATDDADDFPLFSWVNDALVECEGRLREVEHRMRKTPTARRLGESLGKVCDRLEEIADEFAGADHTGT